MFKPLPLYIGLRYVRSGRGHRFLSLISLLSMLGIALGVTVLITVLSVVNGFDREIKRQLFSMVPPIMITSDTGRITHWSLLEEKLRSFPDVTAVAPLVSGQGLLSNATKTIPIVLVGILPAKEITVSDINKKMVQGNLSALIPHDNGIVLGEAIAKQFGVLIGDKLTVLVPHGQMRTSSLALRVKKFTVVGIFRAGGGGFAFDSRFAFIHLSDAQALYELGQAITTFHININDIYQAQRIADHLQSILPESLRAGDWTEQLGAFFENIRMTKTMMFFIFILIITVAVFNLVCTLVMVVKNKQGDIAILRTFGATPRMILLIFVVQGTLIALGGILLGVLGGVILAWNMPALSSALQTTLHIELISAKVYFVNYLPTELQWRDVVIISSAAFFLSLIATLYPALKAARAITAEVLNNE